MFFWFGKTFGGLMKFDLWSKTLLRSYGMLDKAIGSIDKTFERIVSSSRCASSYDTLFNGTELIADKLLNLIQKKKILVKTQDLVNDILNNMDEYHAKLLVLKYIKNISNEELSAIFEKSVRTVLRHSLIALDEFGTALELSGMTPTDFMDAYLEQKWILEIYKKIEKEEVVYAKRTENHYNKSN